MNENLMMSFHPLCISLKEDKNGNQTEHFLQQTFTNHFCD